MATGNTLSRVCVKTAAMNGEEIPRAMPERTGRHYCVSCLAETPAEVYFRNDHICEACNDSHEEFPLASTPEDTEEPSAEPEARAGGE
ncbi:MAG: hypothetical protein LC732_11165 [Acidobacteria bacterium]|nr:hypothetical protein [Acidobacteriota bacterium]